MVRHCIPPPRAWIRSTLVASFAATISCARIVVPADVARDDAYVLDAHDSVVDVQDVSTSDVLDDDARCQPPDPGTFDCRRTAALAAYFDSVTGSLPAFVALDDCSLAFRIEADATHATLCALALRGPWRDVHLTPEGGARATSSYASPFYESCTRFEHDTLPHNFWLDLSGCCVRLVAGLSGGVSVQFQGSAADLDRFEFRLALDTSATCARCASLDTLVATPLGERAIDSLREGDLVYSVANGAFVVVPIQRVVRVPAPDHHVVRVELTNGRSVAMSEGHPLVDGRSFGDLREGDDFDGVARVLSLERVAYRHRYTVDILPRSPTGAYIASGAVVGSTLFERSVTPP